MNSPSKTARLLTLAVLVVTTLAGLSVLSAPAGAVTVPSITGIAARSGPLAGDQTVTIRGYHLTGTTSVRFGTTATTKVQVVSDTQLTVRTPAHAAGKVSVRVVEPGVISAPAVVATYIYVAAPAQLTFSGPRSHTVISAIGVSCAAANFCAGVGQREVGRTRQNGAITYNGTRWSAFVNLGVSDSSFVEHVSCTAVPARMCMAVSSDGYAFRFNGTSWSRTLVDRQPRVGFRPITSISCPRSTLCYAVDSSGNALRYNGSTWTAPHRVLPTGGFNSISCPTTAFCYAVSDSAAATGVRLRNGRWDPAHPIAPGTTFTSISCSSAAFCLATADDSYRVYTGLAWSPAQSSDATVGFPSVGPECESALFCAIDYAQDEITSVFSIVNGAVRSMDPPLDGGLSLGFGSAITCWTASSCLLLSSSTARTTSLR